MTHPKSRLTGPSFILLSWMAVACGSLAPSELSLPYSDRFLTLRPEVWVVHKRNRYFLKRGALTTRTGELGLWHPKFAVTTGTMVIPSQDTFATHRNPTSECKWTTNWNWAPICNSKDQKHPFEGPFLFEGVSWVYLLIYFWWEGIWLIHRFHQTETSNIPGLPPLWMDSSPFCATKLVTGWPSLVKLKEKQTLKTKHAMQLWHIDVHSPLKPNSRKETG